MTSRVLVTGGAGFIGTNLVPNLLDAGKKVLCIDALTYAANKNSLEVLQQHHEFQFCQADVQDGETIRSLVYEFRPSAILHLAAESHVDRSINKPRSFIHTNIVGTFEMLRAALDFLRSLGPDEQELFRFVHVSTDEVYGSLSFSEGGFSESHRYAPHSPYSSSKAASDHLARAWHATYGLPVIVTNCSNNYGPWQHPEKFIPLIILKCLAEDPIPVYGNGDNIRDWIYVGDHCRALQAVLHRGVPGETYNVGANNERTNLELVHAICTLLDEIRPSSRLASYKSLIAFVADRPGHDLRYAIDASKIGSELGWIPKTSFEAGLRKTIQWYLENEALCRERILTVDHLHSSEVPR